jgi:hypothetical protein
VLKKTSTTTRLIDMTVALLGNTAAASNALHCSELELESWRAGIMEPPWIVFERMVDILIEHQAKQITEQRAALRQLRSGDAEKK